MKGCDGLRVQIQQLLWDEIVRLKGRDARFVEGWGVIANGYIGGFADTVAVELSFILDESQREKGLAGAEGDLGRFGGVDARERAGVSEVYAIGVRASGPSRADGGLSCREHRHSRVLLGQRKIARFLERT